MGYFVTKGNVYYEGDQMHETDVAVSERPGPNYDFINGVWVESDQESVSVSYPKETIIEDRATGELYEVFVENGKLGSDKLEE